MIQRVMRLIGLYLYSLVCASLLIGLLSALYSFGGVPLALVGWFTGWLLSAVAFIICYGRHETWRSLWFLCAISILTWWLPLMALLYLRIKGEWPRRANRERFRFDEDDYESPDGNARVPRAPWPPAPLPSLSAKQEEP